MGSKLIVSNNASDYTPPSDCATLERAKRLVNEAMFTVALQHRRLHSSEPEDKTFVFRRWADFQFMIVSLTKLRRAAVIATQVPDIGHEVGSAIEAFDRTLPDLTLMRNIGEHIDEYALDSPDRHNKRVSRRQLEVGSWDETTFRWLCDEPSGRWRELDINHALRAAEELYMAIRAASISSDLQDG